MQPASANETTVNELTADKITEGTLTVTLPVFKPKAKYSYELPDGKTCKVRFPTDEEWCARQRAVIDITRSVGRGKVKTDSKGDEEASFELFTAIRLDKDGPAFDIYEAAKIIDELSERQVIDVRRKAENFQITLAVPGVEVVHILRVPSLRQVWEFGKVAVSSSRSRRGNETQVMLEPSGGLWDKLVVDVAGYAENVSTAVPIIHKDASLAEVLMQVNTEVKGGPDPED